MKKLFSIILAACFLLSCGGAELSDLVKVKVQFLTPAVWYQDIKGVPEPFPENYVPYEFRGTSSGNLRKWICCDTSDTRVSEESFPTIEVKYTGTATNWYSIHLKLIHGDPEYRSYDLIVSNKLIIQKFWDVEKMEQIQVNFLQTNTYVRPSGAQSAFLLPLSIEEN